DSATDEDSSLKLEDSNTVEYLSPVNCSGLLEKAQAAIFLSLDELWNTSNSIGSDINRKPIDRLTPQALKLLPFATAQECEETEAQVRAELSLFEDQVTVSNNTEIERSSEPIAHKNQNLLKWWEDRCISFPLL
ncbi:31405_t:CDS:2, partial [Racocetra persica]